MLPRFSALPGYKYAPACAYARACLRPFAVQGGGLAPRNSHRFSAPCSSYVRSTFAGRPSVSPSGVIDPLRAPPGARRQRGTCSCQIHTSKSWLPHPTVTRPRLTATRRHLALSLGPLPAIGPVQGPTCHTYAGAYLSYVRLYCKTKVVGTVGAA